MVTNYALKCRIHLHSPFYVIGYPGKKRFPYKKERSKFRSGRNVVTYNDMACGKRASLFWAVGEVRCKVTNWGKNKG